MLKGIDISHWDEFPPLDNVDFVIVKATQGKNFVDPKFREYANNVLKSGKMLGLYHFANEDGDPKGSAAFFVKHAKDYIGKCILCLDWEYESENNNPLTQGQNYVLDWCNEVERLTGVMPLVYMSSSVTKAYRFNKVVESGYKLWVAQYPPYEHPTWKQAEKWEIPEVGNWNEPAMWQFCSDGILSESGEYDLDLFFGSMLQWSTLMTVHGVYEEDSWKTVYESGEIRLQVRN